MSHVRTSDLAIVDDFCIFPLLAHRCFLAEKLNMRKRWPLFRVRQLPDRCQVFGHARSSQRQPTILCPKEFSLAFCIFAFCFLQSSSQLHFNMVNFSAEIPPVLSHPAFDEDECRRVWTKHTWETGGNDRDAKHQLPACGTQDIENLCCVIREFKEHMPAARLHLTQGTDRFAKFREVLHCS